MTPQNLFAARQTLMLIQAVMAVQRISLYQILARSYHLKGDSKNYEVLLEKIIRMTDAVYQANSAQAIADFETKYQVQKKEATIAQQQLALTRENYLFYGSVLIAALGVIIAFLIFTEIRRKQKLRLQQLHEEEMLLSEKAVADAEETERRRIAADLHDNLGAQLSFIKRNVDFIMDQPAGFSHEDERKYLSSVNDIAQNAMIDLRETLWVLNKDEVSIQEFADKKFKSYLKQQLMGKDMIKWDFKERIQENWRLPSGEVMHLFRIVQEVISNIIKHAEAEKIAIQFDSSSPQAYQLEIFDNGKGFDVNNKFNGHYGLENIQQRAKEISAKLLITSSSDAGTSMMLTKDGTNNANELFFSFDNVFNFIIMKIPIAIVDDNTQNRLSLADQMSYSDEITVRFTAKNGDDFLEKMKELTPALHPSIVLMDIEMPEMTGIEAVKYAHLIYPDLKFLMLTVFDDDDKIFEAIKNGANGYLLKDEKTSTIIDHIQQLLEIGGAPAEPIHSA